MTARLPVQGSKFEVQGSTVRTLIRLLLLSFILYPLSLPSAPTQGSGARLLIRWSRASRQLPPLPPVAASRKSAAIRTYYFAATAVSTNGLESDYSDEVQTTVARPTLAWEDTHQSPRTTYTIYRGTNTARYTASWSAGTNLSLTIPPPILKTNRVITITTVNATNLAYRPLCPLRPYVPWTLLNTNYLRLVNPTTNYQYRPLGRSRATPARATITLTTQ
jgi:hypothetical protein